MLSPLLKIMENLISMQHTYNRDWIGGRGIFGTLFWINVPFLANIERYPKFAEYPLTRDDPDKVSPDIDFIDEAVVQC